MKGKCKKLNDDRSDLDIEAVAGHEPLEGDTMPENKLKKNKIDSKKPIPEAKIKIEPKKENLESKVAKLASELNYVETYI